MSFKHKMDVETIMKSANSSNFKTEILRRRDGLVGEKVWVDNNKTKKIHI